MLILNIFKFDLEYPKELNELNNDYSLAPDLYNISIENVKKLVPKFFDNEMYVLHYENLRLYLGLGNQSQWLKPYIEFNT